MHRHAGGTIGVTIGNNTEAAGIDGIAGLHRHQPRGLPTSGNIQEIDIPNRWNGSRICTSRITVTSRVIP
jgi:hypothetical protein